MSNVLKDIIKITGSGSSPNSHARSADELAKKNPGAQNDALTKGLKNTKPSPDPAVPRPIEMRRANIAQSPFGGKKPIGKFPAPDAHLTRDQQIGRFNIQGGSPVALSA